MKTYFKINKPVAGHMMSGSITSALIHIKTVTIETKKTNLLKSLTSSLLQNQCVLLSVCVLSSLKHEFLLPN